MCDACRDAVITIAKHHASPQEIAADLPSAEMDRVAEAIVRRTIVAFSVRVLREIAEPQEVVASYVNDVCAAFEEIGIGVDVAAEIVVTKPRAALDLSRLEALVGAKPILH